MKKIIIESEAENELSDSVAFYERREPGLGLEFERTARGAVLLKYRKIIPDYIKDHVSLNQLWHGSHQA